MADEKKYLRGILKRTRAALPRSIALARSAKIQSLLLATDFYRSARTVVLYAAEDNEVATDAVLDDALAGARVVLYPRLEPTGPRLALGRVRTRNELSPGVFGIPEPQASAESIEPEALGKCLVLVPGVAFSPRGERLGRGGGHYDRLLSELGPQALTVGLAYSFQLLDCVPQSGWDRRLSYVVTESAVYAADADSRCVGRRGQQGGIPG